MTQKLVTVTLENLDITQLYKIRRCFSNENCSRNNVNGAYMYKLRELIDAILDNGYRGVDKFKVPDLNIG